MARRSPKSWHPPVGFLTRRARLYPPPLARNSAWPSSPSNPTRASAPTGSTSSIEPLPPGPPGSGRGGLFSLVPIPGRHGAVTAALADTPTGRRRRERGPNVALRWPTPGSLAGAGVLPTSPPARGTIPARPDALPVARPRPRPFPGDIAQFPLATAARLRARDYDPGRYSAPLIRQARTDGAGVFSESPELLHFQLHPRLPPLQLRYRSL